jgi:hypothetical protein
MGQSMGSSRSPSCRGESTGRTRQLSRLRLFFAPGIDREGDYDVADEFGLCGDRRFGPDNIGRERRACAHLLRYLPTALSVFPFGEGLLLSSRSAHARRTGASVHRKKRHRQCRKHTGPRLMGLRRDERKNNGSLMEPSQPRRCRGRRPHRMQPGEHRRELPCRHVQCLSQDARRSARHSSSLADASSVN